MEYKAADLIFVFLPELLFLVSFVKLWTVLKKREGNIAKRSANIQFWARMVIAAIAVELMDLLRWLLPQNLFRIAVIIVGALVMFFMRSMVIVIREK